MRAAVFVVVMAIWASTTYAVTYHVSKSGSPSNSCPTATTGGTSARLTLSGPNGGCACLSAGDTLLVDDGVYNEQISRVDDSEHPTPCIPPSGSSVGARTIIKSKNFRGATLNKPNVSPANHVVFLDLNDFISVEDFVIDGRGHGACVWLGYGATVAGHKASGNYVTNCGGNGFYVDHNSSDSNSGRLYEILDNEIVNVAQEHSTEPGAHAIYYIGRDGMVKGNYIHGSCPFYGIHATSETGGLSGNTIENNRVVGCQYAGIVNQGGTTVVRNNLVEDNRIGIQAQGSSNQKVYNNTIFDWRTGPGGDNESYGILDLTGGGVDIRNNLVLQQRDVASLRRYIFATVGTPTLQSNLCDGVNPQNCQVNVGSYATVVVDGYGGDLTLVEGGQAVDAGTTLTDVPLDRLGVTRPQFTGYDIGAYEFTTAVVGTVPTVFKLVK